jgi:hypothetical protein
MHLVMWTFDVMEGKNRKDLVDVMQGSSADERDAPGLVRKLCCIADDERSVVELYVWRSRADADAFFDGEWDGETSRRWESARMTRRDYDVPVALEGGKALAGV